MKKSYYVSDALHEYGETVREWSVAEVRPYARQADNLHAPPENWREIMDTCPVPLVDFYDNPALPIPQFEEGPWVRKLVTVENLLYGDCWPCAVVPQVSAGYLLLDRMGTQAQRDRWSGILQSTEAKTALGFTEPGCGSDTSMIATAASRHGDTWVLNGTKMFCSAGAFADFVIVFATIDKALGAKGIRAFLVPKGTPGLIVAKANESKLGLRGAITSELVFQNCSLPLDHMLGWGIEDEPPSSNDNRIKGRAGGLSVLSNNRPMVSAMAVGIAQAALDVASALLTERHSEFSTQRWSAIVVELESMNATLVRARRLNFYAQLLADKGVKNVTESSMAKAYGPPTCERVVRRSMQLIGPDGISTEHLLEKWYRDIKVYDIFEGTGQIQRTLVARALVGELAQ
ncbi:MAG TPA: acyl-CoA dehydrogenase family protein [Acidimicrobiales bacterium]|nr:acyl-CoA dehydrogenase family protein [Acidimicrobiales bacterium]